MEVSLNTLVPVEVIALALQADPSSPNVTYETALMKLCKKFGIHRNSDTVIEDLTIAICSNENMHIETLRGQITNDALLYQRALQLYNVELAKSAIDDSYRNDFEQVKKRLETTMDKRRVKHDIEVGAMVSAMLTARAEEIAMYDPTRFDFLFE